MQGARHNVRRAAWMSALALAGASAGAGIAQARHLAPRAGATAAKVYIAAKCQNHVYKPRRVIFACADGSFYATSLRYASYGSRQAVASGTMHYNDCKPNCAAGHFHQRRGRVRFSRVVRCADGRRYFSRAHYRFGKRAGRVDIAPFNCGR
jgi:hypothetical protein